MSKDNIPLDFLKTRLLDYEVKLKIEKNMTTKVPQYTKYRKNNKFTKEGIVEK